MNVKPMLGEWEIPHIAAIRSRERRALVEHAVPGRQGSVFQDLGAAPLRLEIEGSLFGDEARDAFLEELRGKYAAGEPVTFVADIVAATSVQYVVIESLRLEESGVRPDQIDYAIVLRESPPPPPPPDPFGGLDAGLLDQAAGFIDSVAGALDAISALGSIPDLRDPTAGLGDMLTQVESAGTAATTALTSLAGLFAAKD